MESLFIHIVAKGRKSNTYKFALAKFLLDYSKNQRLEEQDYKISFGEIANKFLEYYWFQECKYKFKQDFTKDKNPKVIKIIQEYCGTNYIPESFEKYFKDKESLKENIISDIKKDCLNDVIPRFQPKEQNDYYIHFFENKTDNKGYKRSSCEYIILNSKALKFFKNNYEILSKILVLEWAKFLEKINLIPQIISKVELMKDPKRSSLVKFRKELLNINSNCFYCSKKLEDGDIHIDHFIPWSYIYEDDISNLVPSCSRCNLSKSDSLAPKLCLAKIIKRNSNMNQINKPLKYIEEHYENCYKAGFKLLTKDNLQCNNI